MGRRPKRETEVADATPQRDNSIPETIAIRTHKPEKVVNGCPTCYGKFVKGRPCECQYAQSCREYTFAVKGEKKDRQRWEFHTLPIPEGFDMEDESATLETLNTMFEIPDSPDKFNTSDVNMRLIQFFTWLAIEYPATARALMIKLSPDVKNLQDIADLLGVTRQAVQKRIQVELGLGKRQYKAKEVFNLTDREFRVYQLCMQKGMSLREAAREIGMSEGTVRNVLKSLKSKGYDS